MCCHVMSDVAVRPSSPPAPYRPHLVSGLADDVWFMLNFADAHAHPSTLFATRGCFRPRFKRFFFAFGNIGTTFFGNDFTIRTNDN